MGKAGVEPDAVNAMWCNQADRMVKAKNHARMARNRGEHLSAHSIMLSAYITALSGNPAEGQHPVKFFVLALWHALCMSRRIKELNHNQLDVWLQFMLKFRSKLPIFKGVLNRMLVEGAAREIASAEADGKPHQRALAFMTYAETICAVNGDKRMVELNIKFALNREQEIRAEPDQPMGLRQFVRVLRKAGELHLKPKMRNADPTSFAQAQLYLQHALDLARGEANAPDQVDKILSLVHF
ncbi:MAG TPA: hypothetical protein VJB58_01340 [Candidatus Paceibacterota bacterium]